MANNTMQLRFPGGLSKALTLSYDDAVIEDERLMSIMKEGGLKGTFNVNSGSYSPEGYERPVGEWRHCRMSRAEAIALYTDSGMEVAFHSYTHPHLESLPAPQAAYEIVRDRAQLEEDFGVIVRGGAYPFGTYNDETVQALRDAGLVYCRTTRATEKFDIPTDWLRMPATCHHRSARLGELTRTFTETVPQAGDAPMLFYLWGHSYEFERDNNWEIIESFAADVGHRDDVWYATNIEIYDYVDAWHRLVFSMNMKKVSNPTATDLYFTRGGKLYSVKAGETVDL
ncbi:MAG: polysaccharide deacetylase family protein [Clostridia bacterium]|nr:polysaccharide deacetylase family protein [Clostridia bacterium]